MSSTEPMFHFLVTAADGAWHDGLEEYAKSRFLEYTPDEIAAKFDSLTPTKVRHLTSLPCLCTYEGNSDLYVARITEIEVERHTIRVFLTIDTQIAPIPHDKFFGARRRFGINDWEFSRTHWAIKQGDLFDKLRGAHLVPGELLATPIVEGQPEQADIPANAPVRTMMDFITQVKKLARDDRECFYRGHSDANYRLMPSVFRTDAAGVPLYRDSEHEMFREILISNSFDFREDHSSLERLVRMQHYSLPTRLLDITANPLIALFFAVWSDTKRQTAGEVILFFVQRTKIKYFDSDTASCLANLALMGASERDQIKFEVLSAGDLSDDLVNHFNAQPQIQRLLHYIANEKPYFKPRILPNDLRSVICVKSKRSNDRISSQSGAFLLFGHDVVLSEDGTDEIAVQRIRIENKEAILRDLELLNITESTVFPYIENSARDISRRFRTKPVPENKEEDVVGPTEG
jgi:hypothetical protein